jgi:hypothetical protein
VTVMPEWFQHEGVEAVLDRVQGLGATAIATSPYVMEVVRDGEGGREPPPDGEAGRVRPLDRALWGRRELWMRTAPSFAHDARRYAGLRYAPSPATALTDREGPLLDRVFEAAARRGIEVYLQVMAASPPGYRVQFSNAVADDQCLGPEGAPHPARVDRNASLASPQVVAYLAALLAELGERYPTVAGFRLDWPEYPPYDLRSALFDFNPAAQALMAQAGADPALVARDVATWADGVRGAAQASAAHGPLAVREALLAADWGALQSAGGPLAPLFAAKRRAAWSLLRAARTALDTLPGSRRRLEPQAFPPPFSAISGFPLGALAGIADHIGIKLYTMHWPMLARYWARDLLAGGDDAARDNVTAAVADLFGFADGLVGQGGRLRYPEPDTPHPVGVRAQVAKLAGAHEASAGVPLVAFVHSYGPVADVVARYRTAAAAGLPLWINRYGYLSDAKFAALRGAS